MKTKSIIKLIATAILGLMVFTGCSNRPSGTDASSNEGSNGKIVFSITHMTNAFTLELSDSIKGRGEELGYAVEVVSADQDTNKQNNQIETAVSQKVAAIIVEPVSVDGVIPAVRAAKEAGIPVVIVNQQISDSTAADTYVGADSVKIGELLMKQVVKDIGGQGEIVQILGPMGADVQIGRSEGFAKGLEGSDVKVAFESTAEWDTDKALKLTENWLSANKNLVAVVSQNDNMALGARKAIEDANMQDQIKVYGIDATPDGLSAVKEGRLAATVSQNTSLQGTTSVNLADKLIKGEKVELENFVECILITKENVDSFIK